MLDVHPPEHGIHGVRDFLLHLLTITVGLLIALGLEASVEAMHHRHERREAEATLREELGQNRKTLGSIERQTEREQKGFRVILGFLQDLREGRKGDPKVFELDLNTQPLQSAGWRTALATGALSLMSYEEVQRYAAAYQMQQLFEDAVAKAFGHFGLLSTYADAQHDPREMKAADVESAILDVRQMLADLGTMSAITRGAVELDDEALR